MFDGPLMFRVNWTMANTIHLKDSKFVLGGKIKKTVDSKLIDSPDMCIYVAIYSNKGNYFFLMLRFTALVSV